MASIMDYYEGNVISNIGNIDDWDTFVFYYGFMVGGNQVKSLKTHEKYGEYFQHLASSIRIYPSFKHSIYTLNVFRHFMHSIGANPSIMMEDMICAVLRRGKEATVAKYISEILDISDYLDFMEINLDLTEELKGCIDEELLKKQQKDNYDLFIYGAKMRNSCIVDFDRLPASLNDTDDDTDESDDEDY